MLTFNEICGIMRITMAKICPKCQGTGKLKCLKCDEKPVIRGLCKKHYDHDYYMRISKSKRLAKICACAIAISKLTMSASDGLLVENFDVKDSKTGSYITGVATPSEKVQFDTLTGDISYE